MTQPVAYNPTTDFSNEESGGVAGRSTVRTSALDAELSAIESTLDQILANLALIQRDDTELVDRIVELHTLSDAVRALIATAGSNPRADWVTATAYAVKDVVTNGTGTYLCAVAHTSGVFATDLAADKWMLIFDTAAYIASGVSFTPNGTIASTNVQLAIAEAASEAVQKASNLADLADKVSALSILGLVQVTAEAGTANAQTGAIDGAVTAFRADQLFIFVPSVTNTGPATLTLTPVAGAPLAAKNIFVNGAALVGGELVSGVPVLLQYDGTQLNIIGGNFFRNLTEDLTPAKTADYMWVFDASAGLYKRVKLEELPLPRGSLGGGTLSNNAGDATNDIDIAAGEARDSTNAVNIRWGALTKQLDVAFAAGTNQGGRSADALANGTWHVYAIRKDSDGTGDVLFDTDAAAPSMPAGYTYFRRIGSILRVSAAIVAFIQNGDEFVYSTPPALDQNAVGTTANRTLVTVAVPTGVKMGWRGNLQVQGGAIGAQTVLLTDPACADVAPGNGVTPLANLQWNGAASQTIAAEVSCRTNTSAQIGVRVAQATDAIRIVTIGWTDTRGRND